MPMETLLEYKCPACHGAIHFDATLQKMKCPYCDTELEVESLQELDAVLQEESVSDYTWQQEPAGQWSQAESENLRTYTCKFCGGEIIADENTAATHCPYCDNPVVMTGQFAGTLRPDLVVPFKLTKDRAKEALAAHFNKKPLLPKLFKSQNRIESIQGIYVPFWIFDTAADASIRYNATRLQHWSDSNYNYTRTSFYKLVREGSIAFDNVPVDGSSKMRDDLMESIEPYDLSQAVDFQTAYLAGYLADKFDVQADTCKTRANERIRSTTESMFASTAVGYATVIPENSNICLQDSRVRYGLLPVWILTTRYQDKAYTFAMNGQTGKLVGDLPIDWKLFWTYLLSIGLGSGALISLLACLFG